jgi:hypothetical protein
MPIQQWRRPVLLQAKSAVVAGTGIVVARVFFAPMLAIPVMAILGAWGLSMCIRRSTVLLDPDGGRVLIRYGLITRRVRLSGVMAVQVDQAKVTIGTADGNVISLYAWQRSRLDRWLRGPVAAGEIGHAISRAAAAARDASPGQAPEAAPHRGRQDLAVLLLAGTGVAEIGAAFGVRLSWANPAMTALAVILTLALGATGAFYTLFALWLLLKKRWPRREQSAA